jgi:hypothetical protein
LEGFLMRRFAISLEGFAIAIAPSRADPNKTAKGKSLKLKLWAHTTDSAGGLLAVLLAILLAVY